MAKQFAAGDQDYSYERMLSVSDAYGDPPHRQKRVHSFAPRTAHGTMRTILPAAIDYVHTGLGSVAGRFLRMFWQPVYRSADLAIGRAAAVNVLGERFTLYRGESGQTHLVDFACAHRGTRLSTGWVEGECIRCLYHGWRYDADGQCVEQPDESTPFTQKVRLRSFPTREYLGLVFAFFGDGQPPAMRRFPPFEREGVLKVGPTEVWPCNFFSRCENTVDPVHVNWTHKETRERLKLGGVKQRIPNSAEETAFGIRHTMRLSDGRVVSSGDFYMPNVSHIRPSGRVEGERIDADTISPDRLMFYVPVDDETSATFVIDHVPLVGAEAERYRERVQRDRETNAAKTTELAAAILAGTKTFNDVSPELSSYYSYWVEDYVALVGQGGIPDRSRDRLGRTDLGVILLRKLWMRELTALATDGVLKAWE